MRALGVILVAAAVLLGGAARATADPVVIRGAATTTPTTTTASPSPTPAPSPSPTPATRRAAYAEPLAALGARSPTCHDEIGARARRNCARTGSVAHAYPISSYGFDVQIGFSLTDLSDSFLGALQNIAALVWMALVYAIKGVLLLLEWAFSLDLLGSAMGDVRRTLDTLHRNVIGEPWFLVAISSTALWGIWRGLVQGRTSQTITGLAATVGLMVAGLVILANPTGTVGHASRLANDASLGVLSAATGGPVDRPMQALSTTMAGLFDQTVRDPWCALEFGSVDYCRQPAVGAKTITNADVWLTYPAQSRERKGLYKLLKGEDPDGGRPGLVDAVAGPVGGAALDLVGIGDGEDSGLPDDVRARVRKDPDRATMQEAGGTFPRFALLALIAVGMTGAAGLLAYIGIRLLLASLLALLLLLFTPAVLLAPAFGESGRATFVAWAKRLVGALAAKLVYSLFLALVLAAAGTLARLDIGWFGVWLVQIAFWWGVLIKRHELLGFATAGQAQALAGGSRGSSVLSGAYHAAQLGWMGSRITRRAAVPVAGTFAAGRDAFGERRVAREAAFAGLASEALDDKAQRTLVAHQTQASATVDRRRQLERELKVIDRKLTVFDENHASARAERIPPPAPDRDQEALLHRRRDLHAQLADPDVQAAEQVARRASSNRALTGTPVSPRDLAEYRDARRRDLAAELPVDDDRHLRAAGIDPASYKAAEPAERALLHETVAGHLEQERRLLATVDGERTVQFDPSTVRRRTAEERARLRADRRAREVRGHRGRR